MTKELTSSISNKKLMPKYWSITDSLRYLTCKEYNLEKAKNAIFEHWKWIAKTKHDGIKLTKIASDMIVIKSKFT